ncbi:MAG TPA: fibronectin type III domain-containing protein [Gaiellaceae bacterium]
MGRRFLRCLVVALCATVFLGWAHAAYATTYVVNTTADALPAEGECLADNLCSLRQAIDATNSDGGDTVEIPASATPYTLTIPSSQDGGGALTINNSLTIVGDGATSAGVVITADYSTFDDRLMNLSSSYIELDNLSLAGGSVTDGDGGAIESSAPTLTLNDITFDSNSAFSGGALFVSSGTVTGTGVTFSNNSATDGSGGAAMIGEGTLNLTNSTVVGNSGGGGIFNQAGTLDLTNVTLDGNDSTDIESNGYTETTISNTIIGSGGCGGDGSITSDGNNIYPSGCDVVPAGSDIPDGVAGLESLADNGGPTETEALLSTSDAIGNGSGCANEDQRHALRGGTCDIGAYAAGIQLSGTAATTFTANLTYSADSCPSSATIDWGDGIVSTDATVSCDPRSGDFIPVTITGTHTYTDAGYYNLLATLDSGESIAGAATIAPAELSAPAVGGIAFTGITAATVIVNGSANPNGSSASYVVNYGTTTAYGQQAGAVSIGSGTEAVALSRPLSGLLPGTAYHVQIVATNSGGSTTSADATFTTAAVPPPSATQSAPAVGGIAFTGITAATVIVNGSANPHGAPTSYVVNYGTTTAYGQQAGAISIGSGTEAVALSRPLSGLLPGTAYHVQIVATNSGGSTASADATFTTAAATVPPPVPGQTFNVLPFSGTVLINGQPLVVGEQIPFGSIIDATKGTVTLEVIGPNGDVQTAAFFGAVFQVTQTAAGGIQLALTGGDFSVCKVTKPRKTAAADVGSKPKPKPKAKGKPTSNLSTLPNTKVVRSLWGNGHGSFTTKGRYAAATVRGTVWHTSDRCDGTNITVAEGSISVLDLVLNKTIIVNAPNQYLAKP